MRKIKVIVQIVEKVHSEAHINVPDGLSHDAIKQHIIDLYNSGEIATDFNIFHVDFESISAQIVNRED